MCLCGLCVNCVVTLRARQSRGCSSSHFRRRQGSRLFYLFLFFSTGWPRQRSCRKYTSIQSRRFCLLRQRDSDVTQGNQQGAHLQKREGREICWPPPPLLLFTLSASRGTFTARHRRQTGLDNDLFQLHDVTRLQTVTIKDWMI